VAKQDLLVVHSSDLHIDDDYTARLFGGDGTRGLALVLEAAREVGADLVVLAGDVFEHNRLPRSLIDRTAGLLEAAALPTIILPGNHDPATPDSVWRRGAIGDVLKVTILGVTAGPSVVLPSLDVEVWGHAHLDYGDMVPLRQPRGREAAHKIAVAHGHYDPVPDRARLPRPAWLIGDGELAAAGADYVALGHWNQPIHVGPDDVPAYYSGSPELARTANLVRFSVSTPVEVSRLPLDWPVS
jgi:DNA repair exonuclease SbcCD nuclease subunit